MRADRVAVGRARHGADHRAPLDRIGAWGPDATTARGPRRLDLISVADPTPTSSSDLPEPSPSSLSHTCRAQ